jgi:anti-sigma factor RsiW
MSDCVNVEMRELLPELLHDALGVSDRQRLEAHVAACAECATELEILRTARRVLADGATPRIDTARIVRRLPAPPARRAVRPRSRIALRIAAAVTFISLGGISLVVARGVHRVDGGLVDSGAIEAPPVVPAQGIDTPAAVARASGTRVVLTVGGDVGDLASEDLRALMSALETLEATPVADPESFSERVASSTGRSD